MPYLNRVREEKMKVCIAEKPSVAREIAEVLGATEKKNGYIEGNGYQVTWTFGHLCTLKEPHDYTPDWKRWSLSSLPMVPPRFGIKLISNPTYEQQFKIIEGLMQKAEMIINCGDAGQEGELIQRWVMQKAGAKCPVYRLWISSLTEEAIREGFQKLKEQAEFNRLYEAGLSRAIGDWLLGMNATRLYTLRYGQNKQVLSIGRVQTPTLALIVNRQEEIENFKPEPYWELKTVYRDVTFSATKGKFTQKEEGEKFLETVRTSDFTVTDVSTKKGKEYAPRLFDLTSLQVECNKKYAFTADDTLKLIQSLYEKKVTTYPRVDTTFLSDDIYPKVPNTLNGLVDYSELVAVTLDATGKRIVSFPDPADLRGTDPRPLPLRDGWLLDRRGVGPRTAFLDINVSDYAALEKAPSADSLLRHVKVRSPFTEMYALPLTADEARRDTAACNRIIAGGLKDCKELLGRVGIVLE